MNVVEKRSPPTTPGAPARWGASSTRAVPNLSHGVSFLCARGLSSTVFLRPPQHLVALGVFSRAMVSRAVVLPRPLQHLQASADSGVCTPPRVPRAVVLRPTSTPPGVRPKRRYAHVISYLAPRAVVLQRPLQYVQVPIMSGVPAGLLSHGQPCCRAHFNTSRRPPSGPRATRQHVPRAGVLP